METLTQCPVCGNENLTRCFDATDFVATYETFSIQECRICSHRFTNPRPTELAAGRYYESEHYVSHNDDKRGLVPSLYRIIRTYNLSKKVTLLRKLGGKGKVIDFGCGLGSFLNHCQISGYEVLGFDISEQARKTVKDRFHIDVLPNDSLFIQPESSARFITLWHVLEHVYTLHETTQALFKTLEPGGFLILALPNFCSHDAQHYGPFWDGYDVPRHIHHFSPKSINQLLTQTGFQYLKTIPMRFDGPYVSIRSERHNKRPFSFLRGLVRGLVSNLLASRSGNYSSLTYVYQKPY